MDSEERYLKQQAGTLLPFFKTLQDNSNWKTTAVSAECKREAVTLRMLTLEGFPYNVFCADAAVINETPKKIIDYLWGIEEKEWMANLDANLKTWKTLKSYSNSLKLIQQVTALPWPLYPREMLLVATRVAGDDGSHYVMFKSVTLDRYPENPQKNPRGTVHISVWCARPAANNASKFTRLLLVDPKIQVPAAVVNRTAQNCAEQVRFLTQKYKKQPNAKL